MDEKIRFNLIDEPWIRVLDDAGTAKEVSLLELFHQAPKFHQRLWTVALLLRYM